MATATETRTVIDAILAQRNFSIFANALEQAELAEELRGEGPFTIFAPNDDAFDLIPKSTWRDLMAAGNEELLYDILTYHIVPGQIWMASLEPDVTLTTLAGQHLTVCKDRRGELCLDRSHILQGDITCANGLVQVIDKVLLPGNRD